jgi:hypothetical protein
MTSILIREKLDMEKKKAARCRGREYIHRPMTTWVTRS